MKVDKTLAKKIDAYRRHTFHLLPGSQLNNPQEALAFIDNVGFAFLWPIKGYYLPSLWTAVAGDRPVANEHDDPGHITWDWKDTMLSKRQWYYGKLLRGKATIVSLGILPYFYALSERVNEIDDYLIIYHAGHLSAESKAIADALLVHGVLDTIQLRRYARLSSPSAKSRFVRALTELQRGLWVLPIGTTQAGAWHYAFVYQLFDRWLPDIPPKAQYITKGNARVQLADLYLAAVGAATPRQTGSLMNWTLDQTKQCFEQLAERGKAIPLTDERWMSSNILKIK
jgi:uncharacterized protein YcaQ